MHSRCLICRQVHILCLRVWGEGDLAHVSAPGIIEYQIRRLNSHESMDCFIQAGNQRGVYQGLEIKEGDSDGISGSICNKCSKVRDLSGDYRCRLHMRCKIKR